MRPPAFVSTVVPLIVVVVRAVPVAAGAVELAPAGRARTAPARRPPGPRRSSRRPGRRPADPGGEGRRGRCAAPAGAGQARARPAPRRRPPRPGRRRCGGGADLREPEQPGPDRQQVAAEGGQREAGSGGGGQPAGEQAAAGRRGWPARQGEAEGRDHLQQEQPPDGGDGPVPGQVQVEMDRRGGDQQPRTRDRRTAAGQPAPAVRCPAACPVPFPPWSCCAVLSSVRPPRALVARAGVSSRRRWCRLWSCPPGRCRRW